MKRFFLYAGTIIIYLSIGIFSTLFFQAIVKSWVRDEVKRVLIEQGFVLEPEWKEKE